MSVRKKKNIKRDFFVGEFCIMNLQKIIIFLSAAWCISGSGIYAKSQDSVHYSDETLHGKAALKRIISQGASQIKVETSNSDQNKKEIKELTELLLAVDILTQQEVAKKSQDNQREHEVRHAVAFVKYFIELGLLAQRYFDEVLPEIKLVKKRSSGLLWRDIGTATTRIWSESLAAQVLKNPSFRRLLPAAQKDIAIMLNKRFTGHFRSFMVQSARTDAQAKQDFASFYQELPNLIMTLLERHYSSFNSTMVYSK